MNPVTELLGGGPAALDEALRNDLSGLDAPELMSLHRLAAEIRDKADALVLHVLAAADASDAARQIGEPSLTAVVARESGCHVAMLASRSGWPPA